MALENLGGSGYDDVQNTAPSSPSIGDTWLDTSGGEATGKIYADLGGGAQWHVLPVQDELQNGRTRELLLLLQDKPVPEVVDPLNLQSGLSQKYEQNGSDYLIASPIQGSTVNRTNDDGSTSVLNQSSVSRSADNYDGSKTAKYGLEINPNSKLSKISADISSMSSNISMAYILDSNENVIASTSVSGGSFSISHSLSAGTTYYLVTDNGGSSYTQGYYYGSPNYPFTSKHIDIITGYEGGSTRSEVIPTLNNIQVELSLTGKVGIEINPNKNFAELDATISANTSGISTAYLTDTSLNILDSDSVSGSGDVARFDYNLQSGTSYYVVVDAGGSQYTVGKYSSPTFPYTSTDVDITSAVKFGNTLSNTLYAIDSVTAYTEPTSAHVTDQFAAPTTAPADFKQWHQLEAIDVTTGGSTSADPVEFEILDSGGNVINSTRIPRSLMDNTPFKFRNRVYSENAGSNGQSTYTIATTGAGGHFGIPILTVVSVKKNGSVLDSANWSFDGTDTVTIDTANVTINSGDTIEVKYDFDVFDSTLQPRAYLNRGAASETSPSISHFRYEYVI